MKTYCGDVASVRSIGGSFVNSVFSEKLGFGGENFTSCPNVLNRNFSSSWNFEIGLISLDRGDDFLSTILFPGST